MIVYYTEQEGSNIKIAFFRSTVKEIKKILSLRKYNNDGNALLYNIAFHSIILPGNIYWDVYNEIFRYVNNIYDDRVEYDHEIINAWVKEGKEK